MHMGNLITIAKIVKISYIFYLTIKFTIPGFRKLANEKINYKMILERAGIKKFIV